MENIKVGDMVRVIDWGEEYTSYTRMVRHMVKKYYLDNNIIYNFHNEDLKNGDKGVVVAIEEHLETENNMLVLIVIRGSYNLIGIEGLEKL